MRSVKVSLNDLLDPEVLQQLQDSLIRVCGVNLMVVDAEGTPVTKRADPYGANALLNVPGSQSRKKMSIHRKLCQENRITKRPAVTTSPQNGLTTGAVPFFLGTRHLGSWVVGQYIQSDADDAILLAAMLEGGMAEEEARALIYKLPRLDKAEVEQLFGLLDRISRVLLELTRERSEMASSFEQLKGVYERLDSTAQMLTKLTNSADVGMYVSDFFTGEILQGNEQYAAYQGRPLAELIGKPCWKGVDESYEQFCPQCPHARLLNNKGNPAPPITIEEYDEASDRWTRVTHQAIDWVDGRLGHMVTMMDITQNKKLQEELANVAYYDQMLGVPNAFKLDQDAKGWTDSEGALLCFDIVSLRTINDVYSRDTGDALLVAVCRWVQGLGSEGAQLYRVDGDEFCYAVPGADQAELMALAKRVRARFEKPWVLSMNGQSFNVFCAVSLGVVHAGATFGSYSGDDGLISIIERILDRASKDGKVVVYGDQFNEEYKESLKLELSLKTCVMEGMKGFEVHYQPIVDPVTGTWCSLEALCRWTSPECGPVPPLVFINLAEQMGLISTIGNWVLETAVSQCKAWGLDRHPNFILDVNLSPAQISDDRLADVVFGALDRNGYPGEKLSLEITESVKLIFSSQTMQMIDRLHDAGIVMALDDFGTGYSSFNNLKQLPVSLLKTEKEFLDDIENDSYLQYLFHMMIELAHAAGMKLIAEGVETPEQMEILMRGGVDYLQGYLFSRPLSAAVIGENLEKFYHPSIPTGESASTAESIGEMLRGGRQMLAVPTRHYQILGQCAHILMGDDPAEVLAGRVLEYICGCLKLGRASIYLRGEEGGYNRAFAWCEPALYSEEYRLPLRDGEQPLRGWLERLQSSNAVLEDLRSGELAPETRAMMERMEVKSLGILPMYNAVNELRGFVGFHDCACYREWKPQELVLLYSVCEMLCRTLERPDPTLPEAGRAAASAAAE